jgi:formylglycine-generating enzyme required for sulfatase activity
VGEGELAASGSNRVNRGGSWNNDSRNARVANRNGNTPDNRNNNLGFRLVSFGHAFGSASSPASTDAGPCQGLDHLPRARTASPSKITSRRVRRQATPTALGFRRGAGSDESCNKQGKSRMLRFICCLLPAFLSDHLALAAEPAAVEEPAPPVPAVTWESSTLGVMRLIPAGTFTMGCKPGRDDVAGALGTTPTAARTGGREPTRGACRPGWAASFGGGGDEGATNARDGHRDGGDPGLRFDIGLRLARTAP